MTTYSRYKILTLNYILQVQNLHHNSYKDVIQVQNLHRNSCEDYVIQVQNFHSYWSELHNPIELELNVLIVQFDN